MRRNSVVKKISAALLAASLVLSALNTGAVHGASDENGGEVKALTDKEAAVYAAENVLLPNKDNIRGNITLPAEIEVLGNDNKVTLTWKSADTSIITDTDEGDKAAGIVHRPEHNTIVPLTVTAVCGSESATAVHNVTVKAAPKNDEARTSYIFAHFTGTEGKVTDEQIYFATSQDGSKWKDMTADKNPALTSDVGEKGVRDPYLIRSPEGDRFFLIATDLSIKNRGGWFRTNEQREGSTSLVVWESYDLVNWGIPRLVNVAGAIDGAGCAWAPEIIYDEKTGNYVIYWSTNSNDNEFGNPMNLFYTTTRDFYTFTRPVRWIDREHEVIDTTMIYDETSGYYYRASKDEQITIDRSRSIYEGWETIGTLSGIFNNKNYSSAYLEGPEFFEYCEDDWLTDANGNKVKTWGLMCDQYQQGRGYLPFRTTNLGELSTDYWSAATDVNFGSLKKRHGTILPVTDREYNRVMKHFGYEYTGEYELIENNEPAVTVAPKPSATPAATQTLAPSAEKNTTTGNVTTPSAVPADTNTTPAPAGEIVLKIKGMVIKANAYKNNKKITKVIISKGVKSIGKNAFRGCTNLKTIIIKSTSLKSVGKNAFKGINSKAVIQAPNKKKKLYKKLLKKKGQAKTVKIKYV